MEMAPRTTRAPVGTEGAAKTNLVLISSAAVTAPLQFSPLSRLYLKQQSPTVSGARRLRAKRRSQQGALGEFTTPGMRVRLGRVLNYCVFVIIYINRILAHPLPAEQSVESRERSISSGAFGMVVAAVAAGS